MSLLESIFGKKYLEWNEYMEVIGNTDWNQLTERIKEENQDRRREIFRRMNFSG
jgi:hypothetical protein